MTTSAESFGSAAGFVLAGGRSSRMGRDKALAPFAGATLVENALAILGNAGLPALVAGARPSVAHFVEVNLVPYGIAPAIPDRYAESGPLAGVHAALSSASSQLNLFLPVDMPLIPPSLLVCLIRRASLTGAPVTLTRLNGHIEPFPVLLHRRVLAPLEERLAAGHSACHSAWTAIPAQLSAPLDAPPVEHLLLAGHCAHPQGFPPAWWYRGANTPEDLAWITRITAGFSIKIA